MRRRLNCEGLGLIGLDRVEKGDVVSGTGSGEFAQQKIKLTTGTQDISIDRIF